MHARTRKSLAVVAGTAALALGLTACAGDDATAGATDAGDAANESITITSAYGDAVIEGTPERVVALGWGAADVVLSLGVVPVGVEADAWGGDAEGYQPWFREAVEAQGADLPVTIDMYPELDVEKIVSLEPDVIIAPQSGLTQDAFDQLSEFVPVVAHPGSAWGTSVEDQVKITAEALGKEDKVQGVLDGMADATESAAGENPEFEGVSFAYVYGGTQAGSLDVYLPGDTRVELLTKLGLELAPSAANLTSPTGAFTASLGLENADQLNDADVLFTWFNDEAEQATTEAQPLWSQIAAVKRGSYVAMLDRQLGMATSVASPLSIPWALDRYVPLISDAVTHLS
ncbi:iron-siderophore ABC transporter substrate-binding protein [Cellulomonas chengniuliangii]|uniref:iron-siderophore ABC transporter substrate-binding protein n=1 Tax=Cellulomonas chengniuliangii TaxID=2968084 RepID=UPI001D0E2BDB|nr:iron-siderophore ABC transporter substrate-binding protein [Cellulomonas chengniuliangii]MCC2318784.1 iron-siderophore ABC transporter substrate-binding protein [Cellulomonas chengniuliangii]